MTKLFTDKQIKVGLATLKALFLSKHNSESEASLALEIMIAGHLSDKQKLIEDLVNRNLIADPRNSKSKVFEFVSSFSHHKRFLISATSKKEALLKVDNLKASVTRKCSEVRNPTMQTNMVINNPELLLSKDSSFGEWSIVS